MSDEQDNKGAREREREHWRQAWEHREQKDRLRQAERVLDLKSRRAELHVQSLTVEAELAELEGRGDWTHAFKPLRDLRWLEQKPPERRVLLEHNGACVLPLGKVGFFVGEGGIGKSWALTQLAIAVATGTPWLQSYGVPYGSSGSVMMAMGEEDIEEMHRRLYEVVQHMDLAAHHLSDLEQRLWPVPLAGHFVEFLTDGDRSHQHERFEQVLRQNTPSDGWKLIVLDPASRFMGVDAEKDNAYATRFVQLLEKLTELPGNPTVLCAHHTTKTSRASNSNAGRSLAARGASALTDGARWQGNLMPAYDDDGEMIHDMAVFHVSKSNYGAKPTPLHLKRKEGSGVLIPVDAPRAHYEPKHPAGSRPKESSKFHASDL